MTTVIHELRTPMTSITGYVELLQDGSAGDLSPTQHKLLDAIDRNIERLTTLANDLLTLARLEQGAVPSEHADVNLGAVVLAAAATLRELIDSRSLEVTFDVPPARVMVDGDPRLLERMVSNLLTNAVKYTEDGGWVRCTLRSEGGQARLQVSDNGIGIPEDEQADLFRRFFRSSTAQEHAIRGSGLGLNIVESIAHNHGGKVSLDSEPGRGSTFSVDLPVLAGSNG
jgi:signal transduction histidine kinase